MIFKDKGFSRDAMTCPYQYFTVSVTGDGCSAVYFALCFCWSVSHMRIYLSPRLSVCKGVEGGSCCFNVSYFPWNLIRPVSPSEDNMTHFTVLLRRGHDAPDSSDGTVPHALWSFEAVLFVIWSCSCDSVVVGSIPRKHILTIHV